LNLNLNLKTSN